MLRAAKIIAYTASIYGIISVTVIMALIILPHISYIFNTEGFYTSSLPYGVAGVVAGLIGFAGAKILDRRPLAGAMLLFLSILVGCPTMLLWFVPGVLELVAINFTLLEYVKGKKGGYSRPNIY